MFLVELVKLLFRRILSALLVQKDETSKKDQSRIICHQNAWHNLEVHAVKNQECYNFLQALANIASIILENTFGI